MASKSTSRRLLAGMGWMMGSLAACAHTPPPQPMTQTEPAPAPVTESVESRISKLQDRILDLETRISALNDKINLTQGVPPSPGSATPVEVVELPAAHAAVIPQSKTGAKAAAPRKSPAPARTHSKAHGAAFASDPALDRFREAKILFDTKRFPDSVVEFSDFLKNDPEHPLASSAQYHLGMSYFEQKEYKLAEDELNRLLLSYPHSSHVPDALLALHRVSEALKKAPRATYYKEKLLSQFPNSPQAKSMNGIATRTPKQEPVMQTEEEPKVIEKPMLPESPETPTTGEAGHS